MSENLENKKQLEKVGKQVLEYLIHFYSEEIFTTPVFPNKEDLKKIMNKIYSTPLPSEPIITNEKLLDFLTEISKNSIKLSHPRYVGHMDSGIVPEIAFIDAFISALNQNMLSWELAPVATYIENQVINWFSDLFGLPDTHGGTFVSGGTVANLTGLLLALYTKHKEAIEEGLYSLKKQKILVSKEAHYSIIKSAAILGLGTNAVIPVETEKNHKISVTALKKEISKLNGELLSIIGIAGVTNTGTIDPLNELADIAKDNSAWFHVDAAYGGALILSEKYKHKLSGIEKADSITFDPHKLLWMPKSTAMLLVRNKEHLKILTHHASYMPVHIDAYQNGLDKRSLGKRTIQGSRRFDALRVWYLFNRFGKKSIEKSIESRIEITKSFYQAVKGNKNAVFVPYCEPELNIICFKLAIKHENKEMIVKATHNEIEKRGNSWISMTKIDDEPVLRMVILNLNTKMEDLLEIYNEIQTIGNEIIKKEY